jgi:hypothetical protein
LEQLVHERRNRRLIIDNQNDVLLLTCSGVRHLSLAIPSRIPKLGMTPPARTETLGQIRPGSDGLGKQKLRSCERGFGFSFGLCGAAVPQALKRGSCDAAIFGTSELVPFPACTKKNPH